MYALRPPGAIGAAGVAWVLSLTVDERIAPHDGDSATGGRDIVLAVLVLAVANVMSNRVLPDALYVPWNLAVAASLVWLGRRTLSPHRLGLAHWDRGFRVGMVLFVATLVLLLMGLAMPAVNQLFEDRRVGTGVATLVYQALIRIPLGTVVLEEIAFRSVLPGLMGARFGLLRGAVLASVCFGLWHVLPALNLNKVNPIARDVFGGGLGGKLVAVAFAVVGTLLAGLWLCLVRYRANSVLASMLAHVATNSISFAIAWFVAVT